METVSFPHVICTLHSQFSELFELQVRLDWPPDGMGVKLLQPVCSAWPVLNCFTSRIQETGT